MARLEQVMWIVGLVLMSCESRQFQVWCNRETDSISHVCLLPASRPPWPLLLFPISGLAEERVCTLPPSTPGKSSGCPKPSLCVGPLTLVPYQIQTPPGSPALPMGACPALPC